MNLVFPSERGIPLRQAHVRERWLAMLNAAGLPPCRVHDLRHTFATVMHDGGEDLLAVQRSLGHSKLSITSNLYVGRVPQRSAPGHSQIRSGSYWYELMARSWREVPPWLQ
jgi:integrase